MRFDMKRINFYIWILFVGCLTSCLDVDVYDEPKETLYGKVIDIKTGENIITEQPNGFRIKLEELSWSDTPIPYYFWGKSDGTFNNSKIFCGEYKVSVVEGPFFAPEPQILEIKGETNIEFKVTPFLSIQNYKIDQKDGKLIVSYQISRDKVGDKILDSRVFVSVNPNVGSNVFIEQLSPIRQWKEIEDSEVLSKKIVEEISGFESGKTYYVKIGARTNNSSLRYNFTKTIEFSF